MSKQAVPDDRCKRAEQLLPDYWQDELGSAERSWLDQHLQTCPDCAEVGALWRQLGELPETEPDPLQRRRFDSMLAACEAAPSQLPWGQRWRTWLRPLIAGFALALLLAGFAGGWWLRGISSSAPDRGSEIAALREEVRDTKQLAVLSMLQQQSANDRLAGISYSNRLNPLDPQITQALLHSLQADPSPDVRLAALDALQRFGRGEVSSAARRGLVEAFQYQKSPLVQIALVDSFLELRPPEARALLQKVSNDPTYSRDVQQRAVWGLAHWN